jgi:hypothetical protein
MLRAGGSGEVQESAVGEDPVTVEEEQFDFAGAGLSAQDGDAVHACW